ncbi:class I SAM-dependent methyltransferase [Gynurincola endophyticus]|uniref:class I SAM-dependent methyltransferase n=1 Tax=Gynurincola endophyticus TaxID=2479004 RepID=UPI0013152809|nr:methyltransferase domain-containing protein [Gynurincola endophyticus]
MIILTGSSIFGLPASVISVVVTIFIVMILMTILPLFFTHIIYDRSSLYNTDQFDLKNESKVLNIHSGFDDISDKILKAYPSLDLTIADFYDPALHTEASIAKAREIYPPHASTIKIKTKCIDFPDESFDKIILFQSAHEIRKQEERIFFFKEINRILKKRGEVIVVEHLRDFPNFIGFNIGFLHFHSLKTWMITFSESRFQVSASYKIKRFITHFKLKKI